MAELRGLAPHPLSRTIRLANEAGTLVRLKVPKSIPGRI